MTRTGKNDSAKSEIDSFLDQMNNQGFGTWKVKVKKSDGSDIQFCMEEGLHLKGMGSSTIGVLSKDHLTTLQSNLKNNNYPIIAELPIEELIYEGGYELPTDFRIIIAKTITVNGNSSYYGVLTAYPFGETFPLVVPEDLGISLDFPKPPPSGLGFIRAHIIAVLEELNDIQAIVPIDFFLIRQRPSWLQILDRFIFEPQLFEIAIILVPPKEITRIKAPKKQEPFDPEIILVTTFAKFLHTGLNLLDLKDAKVKVLHVEPECLQEEIKELQKAGWVVKNQFPGPQRRGLTLFLRRD
ncbi:MAG: hypothetical protein GF308_02360 [Candidatus Heimdallarchaeota archaeon]|nr:hypothetical protein [Candidatus Heimdallarchaeota archaeon]